jgi:hypothetical protein
VFLGFTAQREKRLCPIALLSVYQSCFQSLDRHRLFLLSGVTYFGDWAVVIAALHPYWLWRAILVLFGVASYYGAVLVVGNALVRYVGVLRNESVRLRKLTFIPYVSAVLLLSAGGILNPIGIQLVWQSALPASAGGG